MLDLNPMAPTPVGKHVIAVGEGKPKSGSSNALSPIYRFCSLTSILHVSLGVT